MPQVPRKTGPDVGQAGIATVFQKPVAIDAFTGPARALEGLGNAVSTTAEALFKQHAREGEEAAQRQARELDAQIAQEELRDVFGDGTAENPGLYSLQGQAYLDAAPEVLERQRKRRQEAQATLSSQKAQEVFSDLSRPREERRTRFVLERGQINRTVANEAAEAAQTAEQLDSITVVWDNPEARQVAITDFALKAFEDAKLRGLDDATAQSAAEEAESRGHHIVITRMLAGGRAQLAGAYFRENADRIDGRFHADILNDIRVGSGRQNVELRDATKEALTLLENGQRPANLEALQQATANDPELSAKLQAALEDSDDLRDFKAQPLPDMEAEVRRDELRRTQDQDMTVRELRQHKKRLNIVKRTRKRIADGDGLRLAEELGVFGEAGLGQVNLNDPDSIKERVTQAKVASNYFRAKIEPLTPEEISALGEHIAKGTPQSISQTLAVLSEGLGDTAPDVAGSLLKGKRPELAVATIVAGEGAARREIAADIVAGGKTRTELGNQLQLTPTIKREVILSVFGGEENTFSSDVLPMFAGLPEAGGAIEAYTAAADALYAHRRAATGDLTFDEDLYEQALLDVMGGPIDYEGRMTIPPVPGKDADWLEEQIGIMEDDDLRNYSTERGTPITPDGDPLTAQHIRGGIGGFFDTSIGGSSPAQFVMVSPGEYLVYLPDHGQFAKMERPDGSIGAYTINLRDYTTGQAPSVDKNTTEQVSSRAAVTGEDPALAEAVSQARALRPGEAAALSDGGVVGRDEKGQVVISEAPAQGDASLPGQGLHDAVRRFVVKHGLSMDKRSREERARRSQASAEAKAEPLARIRQQGGRGGGITVPTTSSSQIAEDAVNARPSALSKRQRDILERSGRTPRR